MKLVLSIVLLISVTSVLGQAIPPDPVEAVLGPNEDCLRCICHARSGCFRMMNCANYSISRDYWIKAGRPIVLDDNPYDATAYTRCIGDDNCIMRAIRGYLAAKVDRDCNCDRVIDCKDYAAIHLKGDQCQSDFDPIQLGRLDQCLTDRGYRLTPGWSMNCIDPRYRSGR